MSLNKSLFQLGIDLKHSSSATQAEVIEFPSDVDRQGPAQVRPERSGEQKDFFVERNGERFAGTHLIIDLIGASRLDELDHIERALRTCVDVSKATLLHIHLHHFTPNGGVSGVAVLAESHISIHSWPERGYAALDVFMCGEAEPHNTIAVLREAFSPSEIKVEEIRRGKGLV